MESSDTLEQKTPASVPKPRRSAGKTRGSRPEPEPEPELQRALPTFRGLSLPELVNASQTPDAGAHEATLTHLDRWVAEMTFESLEGVVVTDAALRTLKVNNAFTRITGYSKREAVGFPSTVLGDIYEHLLLERSWNDEVIGRKKGGATYCAKLRVKAVVDANDRVTHYIATFNDLSAKKALEKRITHLGFTDSLTGLRSRSAMLISLQRAMDKCREQQNHAAVLLVDIDDFKSHNVRLGHLAGDLLLQQSARRLVQALGPEAAIARLFADKFLIVLEELGANLQDARASTQHLATRVRNCFADAFDVNAAGVRISVSMGLCLIGMRDSISTDVLIDRAELVTYNAKQAGGDCIYSFEFGAMEHEG